MVEVKRVQVFPMQIKKNFFKSFFFFVSLSRVIVCGTMGCSSCFCLVPTKLRLFQATLHEEQVVPSDVQFRFTPVLR